MIISITGHRPDKLPNKQTGYKLPNPTYIHVCQNLEKIFKEQKPIKVISGMALGVDQWAAYIAYKLNIPFVAAVPFEGQESKWPASSQELYQKLLEKASEVVIVSGGGYSSDKLQIRNQWMVDYSDKVVAVWDGTAGGTANCINYAKLVGREIIFINPHLHKL